MKPQTADFHEALAYDFDDVKPDSTVVTMRWDKVAVPFKVAVNLNDIVEASVHRQLRGLNQYYWEGWDDAANYFLASKTNLDEALKDEDQSIQTEERFDNLHEQVADSRDHGAQRRSRDGPQQGLGESQRPATLLLWPPASGQKKQEEAFAIYRSNAKKYPDFWTSHVGLARVYSGQGEFDKAVKEMQSALPGVPDDANRSNLEKYVKRLQSKEDINR